MICNLELHLTNRRNDWSLDGFRWGKCNSKHQNHSLNFSDKTYGHWTSRVSLFQSRPEFLHDCFSSIFSRTALSAWLFWAKYFTMDSTHSTFFLLLLRYNDEAKPPKNRSEMFNPKLIENGSRYGNVSKVATHSRLSWPFFLFDFNALQASSGVKS